MDEINRFKKDRYGNEDPICQKCQHLWYNHNSSMITNKIKGCIIPDCSCKLRREDILWSLIRKLEKEAKEGGKKT